MDSFGLLTHKTEVEGETEMLRILTMSDSFILIVILLTASVALLNILRRPAPLNVWVPTARGSYRTKGTGMTSYLLSLVQVWKNCHESYSTP